MKLSHPKRQAITRQTIALATIASVMSTPLLSGIAFAQDAFTANEPRPVVRGEINISHEVNMAPKGSTVSLNLRDASIRDVLNIIAQQGGFNVILDESVDGNLTVDIQNISINKALEYIMTVAELDYLKDGNTLIIASASESQNRNFNAQTLKAIPVLYKSASQIADQLNATLFSIPRPGGSKKPVAASDPDSNSLLVMGTQADFNLVANALRELDVPRNRKVYHIRNSDPYFVAQVLAANFFNSSSSSSSSGGSSSSGSSGGASGASGSSGGGSSSGGGAASSGGSSSGGSSGSSSSTSSGSSSASASGPQVLTASGVTFVAEAVSQTLTVMATEEQLALIDSAIKEVDVRRPQVSIEVSLVEVQGGTDRILTPTFGPIVTGSYTINLLNNNDTNTLTFAGGPLFPGGFKFRKTSLGNPISFTNNLRTTNAKVLANPTIIARDGTTSRFNITDEIPTITSQTSVSAGVAVATVSITKENAGITLSVLPHIFNDGSVELQLNPEVSQPIRQVSQTVSTTGGGTSTASTFLLSRRTLDIQSARVKDGQSLVIGGLLRETQSMDIRKVPGLSDLPIVGAMLRATTSSLKNRTELVLMVTPHIIKDDAATYFSQPLGPATGVPYSGVKQGGFQPVSLPKTIQSSSSKNAERSDAPMSMLNLAEPETVPDKNPSEKLHRSDPLKPDSIPVLEEPDRLKSFCPEHFKQWAS